MSENTQHLKDYPRILILAIGRINQADASNNGLLLRNLFGKFPRENLAQIYSSGDNGDNGFFGNYYQLGAKDRRFGSIFYKIKKSSGSEIVGSPGDILSSDSHSLIARIAFRIGRRYLIENGTFELIFTPRISSRMSRWICEFNPQIIFAQGYSLAFTLLPLNLAESLNIPLAYYPTDDWAENRYRPELGRISYISGKTRAVTLAAERALISKARLRIAFNPYMREEYLKRHGEEFIVLSHGDELDRFLQIEPIRNFPNDTLWIVTAGYFDTHRIPLLEDLDNACSILEGQGVKARVTVLPANENPVPGTYHHIEFMPTPSHRDLVAALRGADILFLPERFDKTVDLIRLSVSSKAHLFMYSQVPTIIYSHPVTGIARYAREEGWGMVVDQRSPKLLADSIRELSNNKDLRLRITNAAASTAEKYHRLSQIQESFLNMTRQLLTQNRSSNHLQFSNE